MEAKGMDSRKQKKTVGVLIGNANSPHTRDVMQGIFHAAASMDVNVLFFLGIHSSFDYWSYFGLDAEEDYDYQFNVVYDYESFVETDALIITYGTMCIFLDEKDRDTFLDRYRDKPCVVLEERDREGLATSIIADNYHGMYQLAEHLVRDHGYRDIAYLSGPPWNTDAAERLTAVRDVMKKYGVPFDESRVAYGDFSACVEEQVNRLLNEFPHLQALICANDVMADTAYRECARRGLTVGSDVAVTGYDDWEVAETMTPPLTTVLQNAYNMGYMAVIGAMELCRGKKPHEVVVPACLKLRESCGCCSPAERKIFGTPDHIKSYTRSDTELWNLEAEQSVGRFLDNILPADSKEQLRGRMQENILRLLREDFRLPLSSENINTGLKALFDSEGAEYLSLSSLMQSFDSYTDMWLKRELERTSIRSDTVRNLLSGKRLLQSRILNHMIKTEKDRYSDFQRESWFLPLISRDMLSHITDDGEFYRSALIKLSALDAKASGLYIFERPQPHFRHETWQCPDRIYLAAAQEGDETRAYPPGQRPVLSRSEAKGLRFIQRLNTDQQYSSCLFCLFSGEMQYGVLAVEIDPAKMSLFYLISREIGNMLRLHQMSQEQRAMSARLEALVGEIREKNEILNFISSSDELTGCLNRRGFMERAMQFNRAHTGQKAVVLFADMDHLKEINDTFGHGEGDYAIKSCASVLLDVAGQYGLTGRIGGDEFCVLLPGSLEDGQRAAEQIRQKSAELNLHSGKQYYMEMSVGCSEIVCGADLVMMDALKEADRLLYNVKQNRRKSIRKANA